MCLNANKLLLARMNKGLSINEVTEKTSISRFTLYRLEKGITKKPSAATIKKLADLYEKEVSFFFKEE
ncbi:helix-turn-helix transcriptional regulator [Clostridium felsineum]|uniref:helix-turn-helix domain-containing protein n=1 Tax=Clostridium felsineum TaxID=36839 RepID=UPI00214D5589|nr:helix-turn-helix transcriptional regulator [Clostridium felsineum]MCR3759201.1 helix-turn-helix transcriptional regulator [Clostridium felsineum]